MDALIENEVYITEPIFMEWKKASKSEAYKKSLRNVTTFVAFLLIGAMYLLKALGMAPLMMIMEAALFICIYCWLVFKVPHSGNKRQFKALCEYADGTPERIARFYEDSFTVTTDAGEVKRFFYEKVTEIKEAEHLYVIVIDEADVDVLLDKNGFTKGDIDGVKRLCQV